MNKHRKNLLRAMQLCSILLMTVFIAASAQAQTPATANDNRSDASRNAASRAEFRLLDLLAQARPARRAGFSLMPSASYASTNANSLNMTAAAAVPSAVLGDGTVGNISMWVGSSPSGNSLLGDSIITQLDGNIGIGLTTPTSKLAVQGMIETTLGGYKFPDGTLQTTAALSGLQAVFHDATLQGNGTSGSPLGVAIPLTLNGPSGSTLFFGSGIGLRAKGGDIFVGGLAALGVHAIGGAAPAGSGGDGVMAVGGDGLDGGIGVNALGGDGSALTGGNGVDARGGDNTNFGFGGHGVTAFGGIGMGVDRRGGVGIIARGGTGQNGAIDGDAGSFAGNVNITGNLSKAGGSFKIDHPLYPENKYLYHSFIESPDMMNIYNGNVITDANGDAVVELPAYFEALNKDFRYQLTVIGTFAQAIVAEEVNNNRFTIKTNAANVKVSWMVTGIRQDAYANKNRIKVEEDKTELEQGFYLHPEVFRQPEERGIEWARHPEMMQRMKEARSKQIEESKRKAQTNDR